VTCSHIDWLRQTPGGKIIHLQHEETGRLRTVRLYPGQVLEELPGWRVYAEAQTTFDEFPSIVPDVDPNAE